MGFLFENLDVYQRALDFSDDIRKLCRCLPSGNGDLAEQLRRASVSIPANIAEGNGRWHSADKRHFMMIARGSAFECVALIELLCRNDAVEAQKACVLKEELDSIVQMIQALVRRTMAKSVSR